MQLSFRIKKTKDIVFDYLTDMQKFASVHPVITKIVQTNTNNYLVYETLKLGFLSFSFTKKRFVLRDEIKLSSRKVLLFITGVL